ncbi:MAG TPA: hypothetical protein VND64_32790 [Pirellulales bacterium]|nr:hypothetical protein [Pirellulales bacterium]
MSPTTIAHTSTLLYDGRHVTVDVPRLKALQCRACGELVFDARVDEQIHLALRQQLKLLTPEQICAAVASLGAKEDEVAADFGVSTATFVRWATGRIIQPPAVDRCLRGYFASPATRAALRAASRDTTFGTVAVVAAPSNAE